MEPNKLIKDKNKLLMAIPVILGILFLYVFFIREDGNVPSGSDRQAASQAFLEPQSEMADKVNDKMEAYKQDKLEEQEKARILKESQVKGSDFYFELQNQQERYDRATLERIRRMQNDPYSEVMAEYGGGRNGRFSHQLESQLDGLEDEQALNEIIREAKKNSRIRKELEESDKYRKRMYERIVNYDQEGKTEKAAANPSGHPSADSLMQKGPIYHAENGKRVRRQPTSAPGNSNLFQGLHPRRPDRSHGQYGTDAVASGRNPIRHEDTGQHAVLRYRHFGSQPPRCGSQQPEGRRQPQSRIGGCLRQ